MQGPHRTRRGLPAGLALSAAALCLAVALAAPRHTAEAAPVGALSMNPPNSTLEVGEIVSITLDLSGAANLHEVHLGLSYNDSVVQVVDADAVAAGVQVLPGPFPGDDAIGTVLLNSVSSGIINYQYELDSGTTSGDGTVATVQFETIAAGTADLAWSTRQLIDGSGATGNASGAVAVIVVGGVTTPTPDASATANATSTPTRTATATRTVTLTPTRTATGTPAATNTAAPTSTARITVLQDSNARTPTGSAAGRNVGVNPAQTTRASGLPDAGTQGPGIAWWRWSFFIAALLFGVAGWFFTFALHHGGREVVLTDRWSRRRRRG